MLSTITSPALLDVIIVYRDRDLGGSSRCPLGCNSDPVCFRHNSEGVNAIHTQHYRLQFRVFHEMHKARDFHLVLCADVFDCMVEHAIQTLEHLVNAREVNGGLDYLLYEPLIISERRTPRTRITDYSTGWMDCRIYPTAVL